MPGLRHGNGADTVTCCAPSVPRQLSLRNMLLRRAILIGALSLLSASAHDVPRSQPLPAAAAPPMVHLPAMFVANNGQWDPAVQFALVGGGTVSWIHDDGWTSRFERWSLPQGHADERA